MKYKVGDKVRVREDLVADRAYGHVMFRKDMEKYRGKTMAIKSITEVGRYKFKEDSHGRYWTDEMLEDVEDISILVEGNKVIAKKGNNVGIAKCSPEDEFNIFTGARLAIDRLEKKCKPYSWLKEDIRYYYPDVVKDDLYGYFTYTNDYTDKIIISRGLVFKTKEEAIECAKKMLAVLKEGKDDED